jgi:hypothetical protein
MITCDRCQKTIVLDTMGPSYEVVDYLLGLVACRACDDEFRVGLNKIRDDLALERKARFKKWLNEWRRNFKSKD